MIQLSQHIDLGRDTTRMKDPRDAARQTFTAASILQRFFENSDSQRWELQLLADEVGMGKTFVALAVAYSIMEAMDTTHAVDGLDGCYQKVLIVTPPNNALFKKWVREVGEFIRRCATDDIEKQAHERFQPTAADRIDDLVAAVRRRGGRGSRVIVTTMNVFSDRKLKNYDLKRRFLLGVLCRYWGNRFNIEARERLLRGAPDKWPEHPDDLTNLEDAELDKLPFTEDEALRGLERLDRPSGGQDLIEQLLNCCKDVSELYRRDRDQLFKDVEVLLNKVYRALSLEMLNRSFPLVIVDEAHNWKNGPSRNTHGYDNFAKLIASRTRRLLLLTATPFQLRPAEMLEILRLAEKLEIASDSVESEGRKKRLLEHCQKLITPALTNSEQASQNFSKEWAIAPLSADRILAIWQSAPLKDARCRLLSYEYFDDASYREDVQRMAAEATASLDPTIRAFFRTAFEVYALNKRLSRVLGQLVIRHRRKTDHRLVLVGNEYLQLSDTLGRPDCHVLHSAPGMEVGANGELPHYLLMRCVSILKNNRGRASLGSALTGCYSTLLDSSEGRRLKNALRDLPETKVYFDTLFKMVRRKDDPNHPKMMRVVDSVVNAWREGEKTLLFCFRTNTATRLREIIDERIRAELAKRRKSCLGGEETLKALRGRMVRRDDDLMTLGLDRVLTSLQLASEGALSREEIRLESEDLRHIARAAVRHGQDLLDDKVDRVFVHRAVEFAVALRLRRKAQPQFEKLLDQISHEDWVERPYGLDFAADVDETSGEAAHFNESGVHTRYEIKVDRPSEREVADLTGMLQARRERARQSGNIPILDAYFEGPSLWFAPRRGAGDKPSEAVCRLHKWLKRAVDEGDDWATRLMVMQALRRALLRESLLLRLLPDKKERDERGWGELLVERFFAPLRANQESMADRIAVFVEDILSASGSIQDRTSARYNLFDATRLRDQNFVALVHGGTDLQARDRIFAGFNTPLFPEVLVCTSIGAEGIDLHRQCRKVIHYDLAWNPAEIEQRTGRVDRIGSKTFREREAAENGNGPMLEIGVPFLAGTYDERMYEELRLRAQTFEVLTGGDPTAKDASQGNHQTSIEGKEEGLSFPSLPAEMLSDLRTRLHVWSDSTTP